MWEMKKYYLRVKEQRNILHEICKRKANWIGHVLCWNCLLQQVIEGKIKGEIEVTGRGGRRRRKLLDDLKETRGYSLDRTMWTARFGKGFGPVVRQTTEWMNEWMNELHRYYTKSFTVTVIQSRSRRCKEHTHTHTCTYTYTYIQDVPGGMCQS
jgi:hypothetical protein